MDKILNGKLLSHKILANLACKIEDFYEKSGVRPKLTIILVGENDISQIYISNKIRTAKSIKIDTQLILLKDSTSTQELIDVISKLNADDEVDGIIVQLPLPKHIDKEKIVASISPQKDVDGFNPINLGKLYSGSNENYIIPCTALACFELIKQANQDISGKHAVIIGRSLIVGRPTAALLLKENCTVSILHSHSKNIELITQNADIIVSAIGKNNFLTSDYIKKGAIVIDVGINRVLAKGANTITGDVDFESVKEKASYITPVPNGVGPMTVAYLMKNTYEAMICRITNHS